MAATITTPFATLFAEIRTAISDAPSPDYVSAADTRVACTLFDLVDADEEDGSHGRVLDSAAQAVIDLLVERGVLPRGYSSSVRQGLALLQEATGADAASQVRSTAIRRGAEADRSSGAGVGF